MSIRENEAVASLKVLIILAKADGIVREEEQQALARALDGIVLPAGLTLENLLAETFSLEDELRRLETPDARDQMYKSAFSMAHAGGTCSPEAAKVLEQIASVLEIAPEEKNVLVRLFAAGKDTVPPRAVEAIDDAARRASEIKEDVLKYSVLTAVLGAFPIPGLALATDLGVLALQVKMVRDIGKYWGHTVDRAAAKSMLYGLGLGTGAMFAVNNLAKLLPGWGSVVGASTSFASTFALGKVMDRFFARGQTNVTTLKTEFKAAEKEGRAAYAESEATIAQHQRASQSKLQALNADLKSGKVDQEEFERRLTLL